ncbi:hypothetical protein D3C81_2128070 [compost metagenome]
MNTIDLHHTFTITAELKADTGRCTAHLTQIVIIVERPIAHLGREHSSDEHPGRVAS